MIFNATIERTFAAAFADENLPNIQQHEWEMRTFLAKVLAELKPERTVELGTYKGWTAALLSVVTSRHTVSLDIKDYGTSDAVSHGHQLTTLIADASRDSLLPGTVEAILGGPIDLLFIDDGHFYDTICDEYAIWRMSVRRGGWIVFHDINPLANIGPHGVQPDCIQVTRFWNELPGNKQEIIATAEHKDWKGTLPHGGIGILKL